MLGRHADGQRGKSAYRLRVKASSEVGSRCRSRDSGLSIAGLDTCRRPEIRLDVELLRQLRQCSMPLMAVRATFPFLEPVRRRGRLLFVIS